MTDTHPDDVTIIVVTLPRETVARMRARAAERGITLDDLVASMFANTTRFADR